MAVYGREVLIAHDDEGSGPPVLLLHAGVADRRMWHHQWEALTAQHRVIRCDLRGFGDTPMPPERFSFAGDSAALLDHLGVESAAVVGSSFGGRVALELATAFPARVSRLVLLCTALRGADPTPASEAYDDQEERLLEADDRDGYVELNVATWLGPDADDSARQLLRVMQRHCLDVQLAADASPEPYEVDDVAVEPAQITVPTLTVSGGHDLDVFQHVSAHLAQTMPNARRLHLPWAGHLPSMERPAEVTALLLRDLDGTG